jgi:bile acid:Na+ symporter, BASS family
MVTVGQPGPIGGADVPTDVVTGVSAHLTSGREDRPVELVTAAFNLVLVTFIGATMLAAGLGTRVVDVVAVLRRSSLLALVLVVNLVVVPLLGWGVAWLFGLSAAATIALILVASSPGAPFGAKVAMIQRGELLTGSTLQVVLAAVGSVTFPVTADLLIGWAGIGGDLALPVGDLVRSVAILQLVPFAVGLALRRWSSDTAVRWASPAQRVSSISFVAVLVLGLGSSWEQIVSLLGSRTLLAAGVFTVLAAVAGGLLASGPLVRRTTLGGIAPLRNAGPAFAAVAIAFDNDPQILAALSGVLLVGLVVCLPVAARLAAARPEGSGGVPAAAALAGQGDRS